MTIKLNKAQQAAVEHTVGPMLVVAGAGTGKTSVIVERLVRLIEGGVDRRHILALTFTEKAAAEMLDRASERLQDSYGVELNLYTFNAFGHMLLEEFAVEIGLSNSQRLVGEEGKVVFMRENLDALGLDYFAPVSNPEGQLSTIADYFSQLKQQLVTPEHYSAFAKKMPGQDEEQRLERTRHQELAGAYGAYVKLMRERNIIDYDDQIYLAVELLQKRPNILRKLQDRYQHIMVDEFQDTNPMQSVLIDLLAGKNENIFAVGDDDQAIYGWRGATLANILNFTTRYPDAKQVTLIENYRSTQHILDSAWTLIQENNPNRLEHLNKLDKRLVATRGDGKKPAVMEFTQRDQEIAWVAEDIARRITDGQNPGSIAVLARSRQLVGDMHKMLDLFDIDHVAAGLGENLFNQPIVLTMVDCLSAIWHPGSSIALYHALTSQVFDCDGHLVSLASHDANAKRLPLIDILADTEDEEIQKAITHVQTWHDQLSKTTVRAMAFRVLKESGLLERLKATAHDDPQTARDIQTLNQWFQSLQAFEKIARTPSVLSYLENFDVLRAEGETLRDDTLDITPDLPTVMTMHKSKGLEWQTVYVIGCNAGSFPYLGGSSGLQVPEELKQASEADERLAEERRLMYVAATRARDELIISYATTSSTGKTAKKPSRFIDELGLHEATAAEAEDTLRLEQHDDIKTAAVTLPIAMRDGDNIVLSASQAEDYLDCPQNFFYKHVLGVPEEPGYQTDVGSLYHSIIESINKAKLNSAKMPTYDELLQRLNEEWPEVGYLSQTQRTRDIHKSTAGFQELYDRLVSEPVPVAVEEKFRVHIPESHCVLKGRIDAVMPVDGGVEMHDYKTSTGVADADKAKRKTTDSKQLTMYALAWRLQTGDSATQVSLDFVRTGQVGVIKKLPRSLDTMAKNLAQAADDILANKFPPGNDHKLCIHP